MKKIIAAFCGLLVAAILVALSFSVPKRMAGSIVTPGIGQGASDYVVFQPGGSDSPPIQYADWGRLNAALGSRTTPLRIIFDLSLTGNLDGGTQCTYEMPATHTTFATSWLTYDATPACGIGNGNTGFSPIISFPTGAATSLPQTINNLWVQNDGSTSPFVIPTNSQVLQIELHGQALIQGVSATAPLISYATGSSSDVLQIFLYDFAEINSNTASVPTVNITGAGLITVFAMMSEFQSVAANSLGAPTAAQLALVASIGTKISTSQPSVLSGTVTITPGPNTILPANVAYTPASTANWAGTAPTQEQAALDRIAAALADAGHKP